MRLNSPKVSNSEKHEDQFQTANQLLTKLCQSAELARFLFGHFCATYALRSVPTITILKE